MSGLFGDFLGAGDEDRRQSDRDRSARQRRGGRTGNRRERADRGRGAGGSNARNG